MNYILHLFVMFEIYLMLGLSLNLLLGYLGLLSLAHAVFYGVGAYISALLMIRLGMNFFFTLPFSALGCMVLALIIALPSLRLKDDYFMLATLAFQSLVFSIFYNWTSVTRGPYGITGIPSPQLFGYKVSEIWQFCVLGFIFSAAAIYVCKKIHASPFGRTLKAIRDDELLAVSLGKNAAKFKVSAFVIAGGIAAIAGAMIAPYISYIDPTCFALDESFFIITIIVIGGTGNLKGPVIGTFLILLIPEILRFLSIPDAAAANIRQIIYGLLLILMLRLRPQGILGEYGLNKILSPYAQT